MEKTTKMVEEITIKRKMTQDVKDDLKKRLLHIGLLAIGVILYISLIEAVYIVTTEEISDISMKIFSMISILITVIAFEVAYRKNSGRIGIVGIEILVLSCFVLYIPTVFVNFEKNMFHIQFIFVPIFCILYYVAKSIIIAVKTQKEYQNNLSDVKEIVKEEIL